MSFQRVLPRNLPLQSPVFHPSKTMARISTVLVVAGITVLASFAAYAAYFDYKRRTDASFRKKISEYLYLLGVCICS